MARVLGSFILKTILMGITHSFGIMLYGIIDNLNSNNASASLVASINTGVMYLAGKLNFVELHVLMSTSVYNGTLYRRGVISVILGMVHVVELNVPMSTYVHDGRLCCRGFDPNRRTSSSSVKC